MDNVWFSENSVFIGGDNLVLETQGIGIQSRANTPTRPIASDDEVLINGAQEVAHWGTNNLLPNSIRSYAEENTIVGSTLDLKARILWSGGLIYGQQESYDDGQVWFKRRIIPEVENWLARSHIKTRYLKRATEDFYWYANFFPEFGLSRNRRKINWLTAQDALFCRYQKQDKQGRIRKLLISGEWIHGHFIENPAKVDVLQPFTTEKELRQSRRYKYIYPTTVPGHGRVYYARPLWLSAFDSGWWEVAQAIPQFKHFLMKNQMTIKYHVQIHSSYWGLKHGGKNWGKMTKDERLSVIQNERSEISRQLADTQNAGKAVFTPVISASQSMKDKLIELVKITPIGDLIKDGKYIEDSREASSHLLYALGVPSTLVGNSPGKGGMGAGSGSDVREHLNMYLAFTQSHADMILEPLNFISRYNGWGVEFRFQNLEFKTQNQLMPEERGAGLTPEKNG